MKNSEHAVLELVSIIFNKRVFLLPMVVCFFCYIFGFKTLSSYLICNNNICQIQEKNAFGMVLSKKTLNLSDIDEFNYANDYDWYRFFNSLRPTSSSKRRRVEAANRFSIFVREKDGQQYPLIDKTFKYERYVIQTVNKLNDLLKQDNVNITLKI